MTSRPGNDVGGGVWTEQKRLILIEEVLKLEDELQRDWAIQKTTREEGTLLHRRVCSRLDILNESTKGLGSHALMAHFFKLLRLVDLESESSNPILTSEIRFMLKEYKSKRIGSKTNWTKDHQLQLIQAVTDCERQRMKSGGSRVGKWKIIKMQLKNFPMSLRRRSMKRFASLLCSYKRLKRESSLSSISFPSGSPVQISEVVFSKLTEYETMVKAYDGKAVEVTNRIQESSEKVSCSEDDNDIDVDADGDDDQPTSLSAPLSGYKDSKLPAVLCGVLDSNKGSLDALADRVSQGTQGVQPDTLMARDVAQGVLESSESPLANSVPLTRLGVKRQREKQNLTLNRKILESLLDTWLEEKGNTKAYLEIVLKGLLEEKLIVEKVREIFRDPNMRGRVSEFTTVDKQIQEFALKQMQLTVQAMHETIKKQMTEMVEQTNQDVLSMVRNFSSSFISTSQ